MENVTAERDVRFKQTAERDLFANVFLPNTADWSHTVVICVHGGVWNRGERSFFDDRCHALAERGFPALTIKRRNFLHKLSNYYATEYDLVAVEDLDAKGLVELPGNSRNRAGAAWGTFLRMLEYKCEREGTHIVAVDPRDTTKECASCGVKTDKPLWVREHSCPSCGFEADRDANAVVRLRLTGSKIARDFATAWNILSRGLEDVGVVHSESTSPEIFDFWCANESRSDSLTPVETALPVDTAVSAKRVVETGSPTLKERTASAVSE